MAASNNTSDPGSPPSIVPVHSGQLKVSQVVTHNPTQVPIQHTLNQEKVGCRHLGFKARLKTWSCPLLRQRLKSATFSLHSHLGAVLGKPSHALLSSYENATFSHFEQLRKMFVLSIVGGVHLAWEGGLACRRHWRVPSSGTIKQSVCGQAAPPQYGSSKKWRTQLNKEGKGARKKVEVQNDPRPTFYRQTSRFQACQNLAAKKLPTAP